MALVSIGSTGSMVKQLSNALGSNAITNALGIDFGSVATPSKFLTKFSPSTVFAYRSLAYELRTAKNFDVIFHWFPRCSQIRTMFSNAFSASDTDEINLLVQSVQLPAIANPSYTGNDHLRHFQSAMPGTGVNGAGPLNMMFLNTEFSYVAHCFYQWISETESPFWVYGPSVLCNDGSSMSSAPLEKLKLVGKNISSGGSGAFGTVTSGIESGELSNMIYLMSQSECSPFTRADIEVKYYSANMKELHSVWFMGAFPTSITLESLDNQPNSANDNSHNVSFAYDSMCVSSPFNFQSSQSGKLTNAVTSALGSVGISNTAKWTAGLYDDTLTQIGNTYLDKLSKKLNKITNEAGNKLTSKLTSLQKKLTA